MAELCFALRPHREYYVSSHECYALSWEHAKKMRKEGKCGTMKCPFYKPHRSQIRLENQILDRKVTTNGMAKQVADKAQERFHKSLWY